MSNRNRNGRSSIETVASHALDISNREVENTLFGDIRASNRVKQEFGLVPQDNGTVKAGAFHLTSTGIDINGVSSSASMDEWYKLGEMLIQLEGSIQWLIGDWLIIGERLFKHGDMKDLAQKFDYDPDRFYDMKSMSLAIPYPNRMPGVSYTHHRIVRALDDRHEWLLKVRNNQWSVSELRKQLKLSEQPSFPDRVKPTLTSAEFHRSFNRIMDSIADEKAIEAEDVRRIEHWIEQVKLMMDYV